MAFVGYMCQTEYELHSESDWHGVTIYPCLESLKRACPCVVEGDITNMNGEPVGKSCCGIVKVEFNCIEVIQEEYRRYDDEL